MRIAIGISYDGTGFEGWQTQPSRRTVQDRLEAALSKVAAAPVRLTAAGRTDTGVHALAQVAHFDVEAQRTDHAWVRGTNANLPEGIAVQWARVVDESFSARYSATGRRYIYFLHNHSVRPALFARQVGWFHLPLNVAAMQRAAQTLLGEHDFSAFRSSECQAKHPVRVIERAQVSALGTLLKFEFSANGFLHHMVRNIVGSLVYVGKGAHPPEWIGELLAARDRTLAAPTFSPNGLYLAGVRYPLQWDLPHFPLVLPWMEQAL